MSSYIPCEIFQLSTQCRRARTPLSFSAGRRTGACEGEGKAYRLTGKGIVSKLFDELNDLRVRVVAYVEQIMQMRIAIADEVPLLPSNIVHTTNHK